MAPARDQDALARTNTLDDQAAPARFGDSFLDGGYPQGKRCAADGTVNSPLTYLAHARNRGE